jgi:hypothetical protein
MEQANAATPTDAGTMRFRQALDDLVALDKDWDKLVKNDGDNIRRQLGTVFKPPTCERALCDFDVFVRKYARTHEDLDLGEYDIIGTEALQVLNQADYLAYSSVFSEYGNGGEGGYIEKSHDQIKKAIGVFSELVKVVENQ